MSIKTVDCVKAILSFFESKSNYDSSIVCEKKNWKRVSKRGNKENGYIREFKNIKNDKLKVFVKSSENDILNIHISNAIKLKLAFIENGKNAFSLLPKKDTPKLATGGIFQNQKVSYNLLEVCKQVMLDIDYISPHNLIYELIFTTLPMITSETYNGATEEEEVDFENSGIISINTNTIHLWAGGDWQDPVEFTATIRNDKTLYYNNDAVPASNNPRADMTTQQIITQVFGTPNPPELRNKEIADY